MEWVYSQTNTRGMRMRRRNHVGMGNDGPLGKPAGNQRIRTERKRTQGIKGRATEARERITCGKQMPWVAGVKVVGCGSSVPNKIVTNIDLESMVETNDEWIATRTGIRARHVLSNGELLSDHGSIAAQRALEVAGVKPEEVDLILLATSSPDDLFGSACQIQARIGATNAAAFDITAACSGFVLAMITGAQYIRCGTYKKVLVIGADALSRFVDWTDRNTCILFGDGCGAALLESQDAKEGCNLLSFAIESDGLGQKYLNAGFSGESDKPYSKSSCAQSSYANIYMNGQDVFKWAVRTVPAIIKKSLVQTDIGVEDIDWLVLHQANKRILSAAGDRLGIPPEKIISNIDGYGNTSAASIPLAFDEAVKKGQIKSGDIIATAGFGAGLNCASALFVWD